MDASFIVLGIGLIVMGFCVTPSSLQLLFGAVGGLFIALGCGYH